MATFGDLKLLFSLTREQDNKITPPVAGRQLEHGKSNANGLKHLHLPEGP
jgi:hypothetical protein